MKMNKKVVAATLGAMFVFSAMGSAFAAELPAANRDQEQCKMEQQRGDGEGGRKGGMNLEQLAAEKGITMDELKAQMEQERQAKLEAKAAEKGVTVDELKAQMEQDRQAKLEAMAAEKGITVDELKAQMEQRHADRLPQAAN